MKNKLLQFLSAVLILFFISACSNDNPADKTDKVEKKKSGKDDSTTIAKRGYEEVDAAKFKHLRDKDEGILLDTRTAEEFKEGRIGGCALLDMDDKYFDAIVDKLDKSKPVLIYGKNAKRTDAVAKAIKATGVQKIYLLKGGIKSWVEAGYAIEN